MKPYVFGIGVLLMLSFSFAGMTWTAASTLRRTSRQRGPLAALALGFALLIIVMAALAWSVPAREVA